MRAVAYTHARPIAAEDALFDVDLPEPQPRRHDLLVEVRALSVNPVDTKIRRNGEPLGELRVLGFDAAGIVRGVGTQVGHFGIGDEVYYAGAVNRPGSNAEFQLVDERVVARKPVSLSFAEAAALPLTALTAWEMLFDRFHIPRDRTHHGNLLIVGGAGGVGSMAIQLAAQLTGFNTIATASRPETQAWCRSMGADHVIDHRHDLARQLETLKVAPPSHIFCTSHIGQHWRCLCHLLAPEGRIGLIESCPPLDLAELFSKSGSLHTEYMFTRPLRKTATMGEQHSILNRVAKLIDEGVLRTTMTENFGPINAFNLMRAHAAVETGRTRGKIVLEGF